MLKFVGLRPKLYIYDYEKLTHYDMNEDGVEVLAKKKTATNKERIEK